MAEVCYRTDKPYLTCTFAILLYVMELLGPLNEKICFFNVHKEILFGIFGEKNVSVTTLRKKHGSVWLKDKWIRLVPDGPT